MYSMNKSSIAKMFFIFVFKIGRPKVLGFPPCEAVGKSAKLSAKTDSSESSSL